MTYPQSPGRTYLQVVWALAAFVAPATLLFGAQPLGQYAVQEGTITFQLSQESLSALGFSLVPVGLAGGSGDGTFMVFEADLSNAPVIEFSSSGFEGFASGPLMTCGAALLDRPGERMVIGNFGLCGRAGEGLQIESTLDAGVEPLVLFELGEVAAHFDARRGELSLQGELLLSQEWAEKLGVPEEAGRPMGLLSTRVLVARTFGATDEGGVCNPPLREPSTGSVADVTGSDVIVADLHNVVRYPSVGDFAAFAVGTTACNIGTQRAAWVARTNHHPVIIQNLYRLKNEKFEQIGMSWVKHGFFAVSENFCGACNDPTDGTELGVGCSDPYSAQLNGIQSNMSPRSTVNAHTGYFPYPWTGPVATSSVERRIQVRWADLDPLQNVGAKYFIEGHYVHPDDCLAGTQDNNASYRRARIECRTCAGGTYNGQFCSSSENCPGGTCPPEGTCGAPGVFYILLEPAWATHAGDAAVRAWQDVDPTVFEADVRVPGEGLFILASKATSLGNGYYRYTYALQNLNSDRSARAFSVNLPDYAIVQNPYFHDILHHSGEPYATLPWTYELTSSGVAWFTDTYAVNPNANALRFDSIFTFSFETNVEPTQGKIDLALFKPGMPENVAAGSIVPRVTIIDCNENGVEDRCDLNCGDVACEPPCGISTDCNANQVPDECEPDCNANGIADDCDLRDCQAGEWSCADCNTNTSPDECEADCDNDHIIDECETITDTDADGVEDCADQCPYTTPSGGCLPPLDTMVVCCFPSGIYMEYVYTWRQCLEFGAEPVCDDPPACPGTPCLGSACHDGCLIGDDDGDGDLDLKDYAALQLCYQGPAPACSDRFDFNDDLDVDLGDYREFCSRWNEPVESELRVGPAWPFINDASLATSPGQLP